jgi:hypothetical protein
VKLLQNKESKITRVLLRQEKTLKLCMNHKGQLSRKTRKQKRAALARAPDLHQLALIFVLLSCPLLLLCCCACSSP